MYMCTRPVSEVSNVTQVSCHSTNDEAARLRHAHARSHSWSGAPSSVVASVPRRADRDGRMRAWGGFCVSVCCASRHFFHFLIIFLTSTKFLNLISGYQKRRSKTDAICNIDYRCFASRTCRSRCHWWSSKVHGEPRAVGGWHNLPLDKGHGSVLKMRGMLPPRVGVQARGVCQR